MDYADAIDPRSTTAALNRIFGDPRAYSEFSRAVCPVGTKPQAVGAYAYIRECADPPSVIYSQVLRHNLHFYSRGIGNRWLTLRTRMKPVPAYIDRYPGKMVSHLARTLITRYAKQADHLVDPFCGSGAVLCAGRENSLRVSGLDVNPFAVLLSKVKLQGFDADEAKALCDDLVSLAHSSEEMPLDWDRAAYWFSPATLRKFQQLRSAALALRLNETAAGRGVLLSMGLSVRPCSRSDQRSPKPFISQEARKTRKGRHFDLWLRSGLYSMNCANSMGSPRKPPRMCTTSM